jgi:hypothetical protein
MNARAGVVHATSLPPDRGEWGGSKVLLGLGRPLREYKPVLALSVLRTSGEGRREILVGVRDPRTNRTHQNVTSVPTRRVPTILANSWIERLRRSHSTEVGDEYPGLRHEAYALLCAKGGIADPLERGEVKFTLRCVGASQGISVIGELANGAKLTEKLTMFNVEVLVDDGAHQVPQSTASYSRLVWADVKAFARMVRLRDVGQLNVGLEEAFACAYGLCLQTSISLLEASRSAKEPKPEAPFISSLRPTPAQLELFTRAALERVDRWTPESHPGGRRTEPALR